MKKRVISGLVGIVVGGAWLLNNYKYFETQGFVAIGMPLLILTVGLIYFVGGLSMKKNN